MLLGTRFTCLADNTVDYWMKEKENLTDEIIKSKLSTLEWHDSSKLQIYIHVPFCTQKCTFCAFSGGNYFSFDLIDDYISNILKQLSDTLKITRTYNKEIKSINIGGGSPDILSSSIERLLDSITTLPVYTKKTDISIEFSLYSISDEFMNAIDKFDITKVSFGVQTLQPDIRKSLRMPEKLRKMDEICERLSRKIPIVNVDLMTGLPGQTLNSALHDVMFFISHPHINSISSYVFSQGSAPAFIADILSHKVPEPPSQETHASIRLHTYTLLLKNGWNRYGTCTYLDKKKISQDQLEKIAGNECLGAHAYEDYLIGVGSSAISYFPGLRLENISDYNQWMSAINRGALPYNLDKSSIDDQLDMALWGFPLQFRGLSHSNFIKMKERQIITEKQLKTFNEYIEEGLIHLNNNNTYELTITGEIFMGHLVKKLKKEEDQKTIDNYINEGRKIGELIASGKIKKTHNINNRQLDLLKKENPYDITRFNSYLLRDHFYRVNPARTINGSGPESGKQLWNRGRKSFSMGKCHGLGHSGTHILFRSIPNRSGH